MWIGKLEIELLQCGLPILLRIEIVKTHECIERCLKAYMIRQCSKVKIIACCITLEDKRPFDA